MAEVVTGIPSDQQNTIAKSKFPRDKDAAKAQLGEKLRTLAEITGVEAKNVNPDGTTKSLAFAFECKASPNLNVASELSAGLAENAKFKLDEIMSATGVKYAVNKETNTLAFDSDKFLGKMVMVVWECQLSNKNTNYWKPVSFEAAPKK